MTIALIDYGSGNVRSALNAFERAAEGRPVQLTADPDMVAAAEHIVLPGVGAFGDCAAGVRAVDGLWQALSAAVIDKGRPFLGVCVGMQLICDQGLEDGRHAGLGWISGTVSAMQPEMNRAGAARLKNPHMGWNTISARQGHPVLQGLDGSDMYFVHSYAARPIDPAHVAATFSYGADFVACLGRDNIFGTQFHPEKSQAAGLQLIGNFLKWRP